MLPAFFINESNMNYRTLLFFFFIASCSLLTGQSTYQAAPADVQTVDGLIAALYDVISGPAGAPRNWDRMRSLFKPELQRIPTSL